MATEGWVKFLILSLFKLSAHFDGSGILARTKFHRAIADEAQFIRNR